MKEFIITFAEKIFSKTENISINVFANNITEALLFNLEKLNKKEELYLINDIYKLGLSEQLFLYNIQTILYKYTFVIREIINNEEKIVWKSQV